MNIFCKWFCKQKDCTEEIAREVKKAQEDCNRIIVAREQLLKQGWDYEIAEWKQKYDECMKNRPNPQPQPDPEPPASKAIKSLEVKDGKFYVNGRATKLYGVSKREAIAVGSGDCPKSEVNYAYTEIKKAILNSNINYIRVLAGKNLKFFRSEVIDYLNHGIIVEVELFDAGNPNREYQADWQDTFDAVKDLPVFFDAHNEFTERSVVVTVKIIVEHVKNHGGIISAGAWSGAQGELLSPGFKGICNAYQVVSHHREWVKESLQESMEAGKPIIMNEIHTRDFTLQQIKNLFKSAFAWGCQGVNIYPLQNWGSGKESNFQKILDWVSEFREE